MVSLRYLRTAYARGLCALDVYTRESKLRSFCITDGLSDLQRGRSQGGSQAIYLAAGTDRQWANY